MKFIIGFITCQPGTRDGFIERTLPMVAASRAEPDCLFFEISARADDPDVAILMEGFRSDAAHAHHQTLPHFAPLIAELRAVRVTSQVTQYAADLFAPK